MIRNYDVLMHVGEAKRPIAKPMYFLIDKQGIVRGKWMNPPKEVFPNDPFLEIAQELEKKF